MMQNPDYDALFKRPILAADPPARPVRRARKTLWWTIVLLAISLSAGALVKVDFSDAEVESGCGDSFWMTFFP